MNKSLQRFSTRAAATAILVAASADPAQAQISETLTPLVEDIVDFIMTIAGPMLIVAGLAWAAVQGWNRNFKEAGAIAIATIASGALLGGSDAIAGALGFG